jgi:hypothetical protein
LQVEIRCFLSYGNAHDKVPLVLKSPGSLPILVDAAKCARNFKRFSQRSRRLEHRGYREFSGGGR